MPKLMEFLATHKEAVLDQWLALVLETYAPETATLWKKKKDPFANPVRRKLESGMRGVVEGLLAAQGAPDVAVFGPYLDEMVRVRAVQDFTPSQAVSFIYLLKKVMRETLWPHVAEHGLLVELLALESAIDVLALFCLDIYCQCRESIYQLRVSQVKRQYDRLLKRANLVCDFSPEDGEEP
ncbi:MAG: RsbRD N-terminal domain-containing protein [Desulfovibrionaceae bacterium]